MNGSVVFAFFVLALVALVSGFPTAEDVPSQGLYIKVKEDGKDFHAVVPFEPEESKEVGVRMRRATCDLLSVSTPWGSLNHAGCAAHCLAMRRGYRGGRCRDGVCHCRK